MAEHGTTITNNALAVDAAARRAVEKQTNYRIEGVKGLRLLAHPTGTRSWLVKYQIGSGTTRRERSFGIGAFKSSKADKDVPGLKLAEAAARAAEILANARSGVDPSGEKQAARETGSFEAVTGQWLTFKAEDGRSKDYLADNKQRLGRLPEWFAAKNARDITRADVSEVVKRLIARGVKIEANRTQAFISSVLSWAADNELVKENVALGLKKRGKEQPRERTLSDGELKTLWEGVDDIPATEATKIAIKLCIVTGQRPKEVCELRKDRLVLDGPLPTLSIGRDSAKNRTTHDVPLTGLGADLLKRAVELSADAVLVFPSKSRKSKPAVAIDSHILSKALLRARTDDGKLFGVADVELYDAKATMATWLGDQGHPDEFIALLLNHKSSRKGVTGKHYNNARYMAQKRIMMDEWNRHLAEVLGLKVPAPNVVAFARAGERA